MDFYYNHNKIQKDIEAAKDLDETPVACKEFTGLVLKLKENNSGICVLKSWRTDVQLKCASEYKKYLSFFMALQKTKDIDDVGLEDFLKENEIIPNVRSEAARTILSCCIRDEKDVFVSSLDDIEVSKKQYEVITAGQKIGNLQGMESIEEYQIYHPIPENIKELFDKVHNDCNDIVFHVASYPKDAISSKTVVPDASEDVVEEEVDVIQPLTDIVEISESDILLKDIMALF